MARLQQFKRRNGSTVSSVNIPLDIIDASGWNKGDELEVSSKLVDGVFQVIITKENKVGV